MLVFIFFFNDTSTTEIYTLSLHDALPISSGADARRRAADARAAPDPARARAGRGADRRRADARARGPARHLPRQQDRKSTRLNSSHLGISYAVFCLKKKKNIYASIHKKNK